MSFGRGRQRLSPQSLRSPVPRQRCSADTRAAWSCGTGLSRCFSCRANEGVCPMLLLDRLFFFFFFSFLGTANPPSPNKKRWEVGLYFFLFLASPRARRDFCKAVPCGSSLLVSSPELPLCSGWREAVWIRNLPRKPKQVVPKEEEGKAVFFPIKLSPVQGTGFYSAASGAVKPSARCPAQTLLPAAGVGPSGFCLVLHQSPRAALQRQWHPSPARSWSFGKSL